MFQRRCWKQRRLRTYFALLGLLAICLQFAFPGAANAQKPADDAPGNAGAQHELLTSYCEKSGELWAQGKNAEALESNGKCLATAQRLAEAEPGNTKWQKELATANINAGLILKAQGNLAEALKAVRGGLAIMERLALADPADSHWQHGLAMANRTAGAILAKQGNLPEALKAFREASAIFERLAKASTGNTELQRDLAETDAEAGGVLLEQGHLPEALKAVQDSLAIFERLAKADPRDVESQHALAWTSIKAGEVLAKQGHLPEALKAYREGQVIYERLAKAEPGDTELQRGLWLYYVETGRVLVRQRNLPEALKAFQDGLAICERLAKTDPGNALWQRCLTLSHSEIGDVLQKQGNLPDALKACQHSLAALERLIQAEPGNTDLQRMAAMTHGKLAMIHRETRAFNDARAELRQGVAILERLTKLAPDRKEWAQDLARFKEQIALLGGDIDTSQIDDAIRILENGTAGEKSQAAGRIEAHPEDFAPPVLYALSKLLFDGDKKDEAMFWFYAAQLRTRFDANRYADQYLGSQAAEALTDKYGRPINKYAFQNLPKFEEVVPRVVEWDRKTPRNYDERWIHRFGVEAFLSTLGTHHFIGKPTPGSVPKELWEAIAEKTRETYLTGFKETVRVAKGGVPKWERFKVRGTEVFFDTTRLKGVDAASFEYIAGNYGKDQNHVFYCSDIVDGADPAAFVPLDIGVGKDTNAVYWGAKRCDKCDPQSFRRAGKFGDDWYIDKNAAYLDAHRIDGIDLQSFQIFGFVYAKDKRTVYHQGSQLAGADAESFKPACGECQVCGEDKNRCYLNEHPVPCGCKISYPHYFPPSIGEIPRGKAVLRTTPPVLFAANDAERELERFFSWNDKKKPFERTIAAGQHKLAFVCATREGGESPPVELAAGIEPGQFYRFVRGEGENCAVKIERPVLMRGRIDGPEIRIQQADGKKPVWEVELPPGKQALTAICREVTREEEKELPVELSLDLQPGIVYQLEADYRAAQGKCDVKAVPLASLAADAGP